MLVSNGNQKKKHCKPSLTIHQIYMECGNLQTINY